MAAETYLAQIRQQLGKAEKPGNRKKYPPRVNADVFSPDWDRGDLGELRWVQTRRFPQGRFVPLRQDQQPSICGSAK